MTHKLLTFSIGHTNYSHSHSVTQTTPIFTQTHRLLPFLLRHTLLPFSLRHTEHSHSLSVTKTTPILTHTHRLIPFLLRHTDYSYSKKDYSHSYFILTKKVSSWNYRDKGACALKRRAGLAGSTITAFKTLTAFTAFQTLSLFDVWALN